MDDNEVTSVGRNLSKRFVCPTCGARPGEPCAGRRGPRLSTHAGRHQHAVTVLNRRGRR